MTLGLALAKQRRELGRPQENAQRAWADREWLHVSLHDREGHVGIGEAAPLPGYSDETLPDAERALIAWAKTGLVLAEERAARGADNPDELRSLLSFLESVEVPSARFALEASLLDLIAQRRGESLYDLMSSVCGTAEPALELPLAQLISQRNAQEEAAAALDQGFTTLKLKIGTSAGLGAELSTLSHLRARFGDDFGLRLDGNQSFSHDAAQSLLAELRPLGVEFIEEPLAAAEAPLENPPVPLALDESLRQSRTLDAHDLARRGVRALILKPSVLGGLCVTLELIERASQLGVDWVLSHTFESSVGYRVLAAFALALGPARLAHGLGPHAALDRAPEALGVRAGKLGRPRREAL